MGLGQVSVAAVVSYASDAPGRQKEMSDHDRDGDSEAPGQVPGGQVPGGQVPKGQVPGGQVPRGQVLGGQVPGVGVLVRPCPDPSQVLDWGSRRDDQAFGTNLHQHPAIYT